MAIENVLEAYGDKIVGSHVEVGGSGGAGHTIIDPSGQEMDQEDALQFTDAGVADDSTNGKTKVSIVREMTKAQYDALSETERKGVIRTTDEPDIVIGDVADDKVEVEGDGVKTYAEVLADLLNLLDSSKLTTSSVLRLIYTNGTFEDLQFEYKGSSVVRFYNTYTNTSDTLTGTSISLGTTCYYNSTSGSKSSTVCPDGEKIRIYYGTKSAPIELITDARCITYDNSTSDLASDNVQDAIDEMVSKLFLMTHPIGSIYMSVDSTNPSTLFGGTWVAWGSGKVPVGVDTNDTDFDTVEETGGTKSVTLTSAQSGIPAHSHGLNSHTHSIPALSGTAATGGSHGHTISAVKGSGGGQKGFAAEGNGTQWTSSIDTNDNEGSHSHSVTTTASTTGQASGNTANNTAANASQAHTNLQPYITCYMWKRTE